MFTVIKELKDFFKKYKKNTILSLIFLSLSYFATFLKPWLIGNIADSIIRKNISINETLIPIVFFGLASIFTYFINIIWQYGLSKNGKNLIYDTRNIFMNKLLKQFPKFFEKYPTGKLMGIATTDIEYMATFVDYGAITIFDGIFYPFFLILAMFLMSWKLSLIALVFFPLFVFILYKIDKKFLPLINKFQDSSYGLNEKSLEDISSIKVIRAFGVEENFKNDFNNLVEENSKDEMKKNSIQLLYGPLANTFVNLVNTLTILGGIYLILQGELSPGQLLTFTMYISFLDWPAFALSDLFLVTEDAKAAINRFKEILSYKEDIKDKKNPIILKDPQSFEIKNLSFSYPNSEKKILKNINIKFNKGDTIVFVGKTGSGKTSLIKQFLRLYEIDSGHLYINDIDIENYQRKSLIDNIAYVPQENFLFSKTIEDNIKFFRDFPEDKIEKVLFYADFKKDIENFPNGLYTMTGEKGIALSGGQRQRIALARALLGESNILILDDVFSAVDSKTEENIIKNLNTIKKDNTKIYATHRLSLIRPDYHVVVLDKGRVVCQGTHSYVFKENSWYRDQYLRQVGANE